MRAEGIVGYYVNGSLIQKENVSFYTDAGINYDTVYPEEEASKRMLNHIKNKGTIRIIIPMISVFYGNADYDITVPRFQ